MSACTTTELTYQTGSSVTPYANNQKVCFLAISNTQLAVDGKVLASPVQNTAVSLPFTAYSFTDASLRYEVVFKGDGALHEINVIASGVFHGQFTGTLVPTGPVLDLAALATFCPVLVKQGSVDTRHGCLMSNPGATTVLATVNAYLAANKPTRRITAQLGAANPAFAIGTACDFNGISTGSGLMLMTVAGNPVPTSVQFARAVAAGSSEQHSFTFNPNNGLAVSMGIGGASVFGGMFYPYAPFGQKDFTSYWNISPSPAGFTCTLRAY